MMRNSGSMRRTRSITQWFLSSWIRTAVLAVSIGTGLWWLTHSDVQLSEHDYQTTLALYRVCNQKSSNELEKIEALIEPEQTPSDSAAGTIAIEAIIAQAKRGQWQQATHRCRQLLESQVNR